MTEGKKFWIVIGALSAFIVLCLLVWACIAIRRVIERRRALADEEIPLLKLREEPVAEESDTEKPSPEKPAAAGTIVHKPATGRPSFFTFPASDEPTARRPSFPSPEEQRGVPKFSEGAATIPVKGEEEVAEASVRRVLDLKIVQDDLSFTRFAGDPGDPRKQHRSLLLVDLHNTYPWLSGSAANLQSLVARRVLACSPCDLEVPFKHQRDRVYAVPGWHAVRGYNSCAQYIRMRFPLEKDLGAPHLKGDALKAEMKKSFCALFDVLLASSSKEYSKGEKALLLPVPRLHCTPTVRTSYRSAYAFALKEAIDEAVAKMRTLSTGSDPSDIPMFEQCLGISCVYVCDPNPNLQGMVEALKEVGRPVPVCGTVVGSVTLDITVPDQSREIS